MGANRVGRGGKGLPHTRQNSSLREHVRSEATEERSMPRKVGQSKRANRRSRHSCGLRRTCSILCIPHQQKKAPEWVRIEKRRGDGKGLPHVRQNSSLRSNTNSRGLRPRRFDSLHSPPKQKAPDRVPFALVGTVRLELMTSCMSRLERYNILCNRY